MSNSYKHGQVWITPSGEYAVLMSYDFHAQQTFMTRGQYLTMSIADELKEWLKLFGSPGVSETSDVQMWRHRAFVPGTDGLHAFFFYRRRPAIMFKLRWT